MAIEFEKQSLARPEGEAIKRRAFSFFTAAFCLICCFATSATSIPMMAYWTEALGLTSAETAMTVVNYFGGCVLTLLLFARFSNLLGRKPVVIMALICGIGACYLFSTALTASDINLGRFLQGLCCGLATSASMAWVVDTAPREKAWLGTAMTAAGPNIGLSLGTLLTGLIIEYNVLNPAHLFEACMGLLLIGIICSVFSTETMRFGTESLGQVIIPKIALPARLRRLFFVGVSAYIGTWGVSSFFQGFSGQFALIVFGESSVLLAAITYLLLIIPIAVCSLLSGRFNPIKTTFVMITAFLVGTAGVFINLNLQNQWLFIASVVVAGAAMGGTWCAVLKFLLMDATLKERAGLISALYLGAYVGSSIPNFSVGQLAKNATMADISCGFGVWITITWVIVVLALLFIRKAPSEAEAKRFN